MFLSLISYLNLSPLLWYVYILPGSYFYWSPHLWHLSLTPSGRKSHFLIKKLQITKNSSWGRNSEHSTVVIGAQGAFPFNHFKCEITNVSHYLSKNLTKSLSFKKLTASGKLRYRQALQRWNHSFVLCWTSMSSLGAEFMIKQVGIIGLISLQTLDPSAIIFILFSSGLWYFVHTLFSGPSLHHHERSQHRICIRVAQNLSSHLVCERIINPLQTSKLEA